MKNLVLIGMMGSGKTTCGELLSQASKRTFVDTDALIEKDENRSISSIFQSDGEGAFRQMETQICKRLCLLENMVIATGGGLILKDENMIELKKNGIIIFLNRDIADILCSVSMTNRPLGQGGALAFQNRWEVREPLYRRWADVVIEDCKKPAEIVAEIMEKLEGST